jgi:membrane fusion protein
VKGGLAVKLVFRAYPQEKFGQFDARIESVSDMPSLPSETEHMYALSEPVFMAVASLPRQLRAPDGELLKIKAGMLADALVPIERRTVLEWLVEPLLSRFHESADRPRNASLLNAGVQ